MRPIRRRNVSAHLEPLARRATRYRREQPPLLGAWSVVAAVDPRIAATALDQALAKFRVDQPQPPGNSSGQRWQRNGVC